MHSIFFYNPFELSVDHGSHFETGITMMPWAQSSFVRPETPLAHVPGPPRYPKQWTLYWQYSLFWNIGPFFWGGNTLCLGVVAHYFGHFGGPDTLQNSVTHRTVEGCSLVVRLCCFGFLFTEPEASVLHLTPQNRDRTP